ncbi:MAG: hypothetical protein A2W19_13215 [Spirochaetes bacterium RBG_16_49_21]|nr:MAG: hypothetical protein A2W19_13215 [Spirochaetes bacterium RBG_16_49_21]
MEQFDVPHQRVREKNVYLLHLDTARIILIAAAVIAIIVVSFLLGMNFIKRGEGPSPLSFNHDVFDTHRDLDLLKNNIPEPSDEEELSKPLDEKLADGDKGEKSAKNKADPADLLTRENVNQPALRDSAAKKKYAAREPADMQKTQTTSEVDQAAKPGKKSTMKNAAKKKRAGKSAVVEVSGGKALQTQKSGASHFVIQLASFDKKATALAEIKSLKQINHDAYLDEAKVGGKQYFRVRIGPLASKKNALDLLDDMQSKNRYRESYMVRE